MKVTRWVLLLALIATLLSGCGEGGEDTAKGEKGPARPAKLQEVSVTIDGRPGPETAGFFMADEMGYFRDAGFEVLIMAPSPPSRPVRYTAGGIVDLAVSHEPQVVLAREKGVPVVAIGSVVPRPTMGMIWLEGSKIDGIADLKGKTVAIAGVPFQESLLKAVLARAGLTLADVNLEVEGYRLLPALVSGRADAIFGGSWNVEGIELESRGLKPVVTSVSDLGVPGYDELVVIARPDRVAKDPEMFRRFLAAVTRGAVAAAEDPETAADAIARDASQYGDVNRKALKAGLGATLPLLSKTGEMSPGRLAGWMHEQGLVRRKLPASVWQTNP